MIKVYFEHGTHAEMVAVFSNSEAYAEASEKLEKVATGQGLCLTESITDEDTDEEITEFLECIPIHFRQEISDQLVSGKIKGIISFNNNIVIMGSNNNQTDFDFSHKVRPETTFTGCDFPELFGVLIHTYNQPYKLPDESILKPIIIDTKSMSPKDFGMRKGKAVNNRYTKKRR